VAKCQTNKTSKPGKLANWQTSKPANQQTKNVDGDGVVANKNS